MCPNSRALAFWAPEQAVPQGHGIYPSSTLKELLTSSFSQWQKQKMDSSSQARNPFSNRILYVVSLNHFINDGSTYLISSLFPVITVAFGFSEYQIGILVAVGYLVNLIFQPLTGRYSEKYEARKLLALGISLIAASMLLFIVSSTFALMLISVLILRFGSSFFHPVGVSAVSRTYHGSRLDSSMGFQSAFGNLGIVLAFIFSAPVYLALGWKGPFLIYVTLEVSTVLITVLGMRTKPNLKEEKSQENKNDVNQEQNNSSTKRKFGFGLPFFFIVAPFISGGCYAIFGNFGNLLLFHNGLGLTNSNLLMALWVVSAFFGAIMSGRLTRRFTRIRLLYFSYFIAGISALGFALTGGKVLLAVSALLTNGFTLSITYPATYSELSAYLGEKSTGKGAAFGILFSSQIAGSSVLGFISGYLASAFGLQLPFEIAAALLVSSLSFIFFWTKRKHN
jgi:MFS transporter, FSR family, fosmidomycin resistance protein